MWKSPDDWTHNQIDHILINKRHSSCTQKLRTFRGANADSDHYLLYVKFNLKLSVKWNMTTRKTKERYNVQKLKNFQGDSRRLITIERKVLRNIFGPSYNAELQTYERRKNQELQNLYNRPNIISYIRRKRLEWFGHVWRADGQVIKEVLVNKTNGKRPLERPRTRWMDVIAQDIENTKENV